MKRSRTTSGKWKKVETKFCTDCIHQDQTQFEEPCFDCLGGQDRPYYKKLSNKHLT